MSGYITGAYRVVLFNGIGVKVQTLDAESYLEAMDMGIERMKDPHYGSFVIVRVLFNSMAPTLDRYDNKK